MPTDGYCPVCHMIVDLDDSGLLAKHGMHKNSAYASGWTDPCVWTGNCPAPVPDTPEVAEAAFSSTPRRARCPRCSNPDAVQAGNGGRLFMRNHQAPGAVEGGPICPGSWELPEYES